MTNMIPQMITRLAIAERELENRREYFRDPSYAIEDGPQMQRPDWQMVRRLIDPLRGQLRTEKPVCDCCETC